MDAYKDIGSYADALIDGSLSSDHRQCDAVGAVLLYCQNGCPSSSRADIEELLQKHEQHFRIERKRHPADIKNSTIHITYALFKRYTEAAIIYLSDPLNILMRSKAMRLHGALDTVYQQYIDPKSGIEFQLSGRMHTDCLTEWRETLQGIYLHLSNEPPFQTSPETLSYTARWAGKFRRHFAELSERYACNRPEALINVTGALFDRFAKRVRSHVPTDQRSMRAIYRLGNALVSVHYIYREELEKVAKHLSGSEHETRLRRIEEILDNPHSEKNRTASSLSSH
jgi:hypothetical protein